MAFIAMQSGLWQRLALSNSPEAMISKFENLTGRVARRSRPINTEEPI
jgi:hypothetical protein